MPSVFESGEPSAADIYALWERQKQYYSKARRKMQRAMQLYRHDYEGEIRELVPDGVQIHMPSTASSIIDHFRDNIRVDNIVPERDEWGTSKKAREAHALLLRADRWILSKLRNESPVDLFGQVAFDLPLLGAAAWKIQFVPSKWATEPPEGEEEAKLWKEERGMTWPFRVSPVDPTTLMPAPGGEFPLPWVIEWQRRPVWEVKQQYPFYNDGGKAVTEEVDWIEYWQAPYLAMGDAGWYEHPGWLVVLVDKQEVQRGENPYKVVPYIWEYSGLGRIDATGDPEALAVNMLEKADSELVAEARIRTMGDVVWQLTAIPRLLTTEDARELKARWDFSAGGILQVKGLEPGQKPTWLEQPQPDSAMWNMIPLLRDSIEKATFSSVLTGQRQPGVDFGYLQQLLVGQAGLRKDNIVRMANRMFAHGIAIIERIMSHLQLGPFVLGPGSEGEKNRTFSPMRDLGNRFDVRVRVEASDPNEKNQRMLAWLSPLRAGVISQRTYLKDGMMVADPDEEMAQIHAEQVLTQIIASGAIAQEVLQSIAVEEQTATVEGAVQKQLSDAQERTQQTEPEMRMPGEPSMGGGTPFQMVNKVQAINRRARGVGA